MNEIIRFWVPIILITIILSIIIIYLMKNFKQKALYKYIPTLMIWLISAILFIIAVFFAKPMQDLGYFVMALITGIATFISFIITILIDSFQKKKHKK